MSIPTLIVFKNGKVVEQAVGARGKQDIAEMLDGLIELQEPTPSLLDIITGAAGIASIIASACLIVKTIKRK